MKKVIFTALVLLFVNMKSVLAAMISVSNCSASAIQTAIDSSQNGDVIKLAGGSCSWSSTVTIPSTKALTLDGGGATIAGKVLLTSHSSMMSRITGFNFTVADAISVEGTPASAPYRIDHNKFTVTSSSVLVHLSGNGPGLLDHNNLTAPLNSEMIHNYGMGPTDDSGWSDDVVPGSSKAVFIEDNTFTNNGVSGNPAYFWGNSAIQSYYGARTVFRYNYLNMSQVDQHGTPGMIGARWWEVYENTFYIAQNGNQDKYIGMRAGSGVIFNNHLTGYPNQSGGGIILYEEDAGYPALYQIGRGKNQTSDPAYVWGNDSSITVGSGSSNVVVGRDFYQSLKPGYTPYIYPHPLTQSAATATGIGSLSGLTLAPPQNLQVTK